MRKAAWPLFTVTNGSVFLYERSESEPRASASGHVEVSGKVTQKLQACSIVFILDCGDPAPPKKLP